VLRKADLISHSFVVLGELMDVIVEQPPIIVDDDDDMS